MWESRGGSCNPRDVRIGLYCPFQPSTLTRQQGRKAGSSITASESGDVRQHNTSAEAKYVSSREIKVGVAKVSEQMHVNGS